MKKLIYILGPIILLLTFLTTSKAAPGGVALNDYKDKQAFMHYAYNQSVNISSLEKIIFLPEEPFHIAEASQIVNRLATLPAPLLSKIDKAGISVRLFEGKLTDNPSVKHLKGVTPRGYKGGATWDDVPGIGGSNVVLVKIGASEIGKGHGSVNLELHELAHSIDNKVYGHLTQKESFKKVWEQERDSLFPGRDYFLLYPEEYFAEAFALYYLDGETNALLKEKAPLTYEMIKDLD
ncbi:toxin [Neobacillus notoginsengisoli]|uniref:Toxin n=1 Tax=Neobacillus notoginsengisoli TaxID=1578198 RepID=A0A417YY42_9BACI|nr:toxin [Neobacillus notoginsengisoli]RHW42272.1 toxin [Neobacillus notoginsengisoli]